MGTDKADKMEVLSWINPFPGHVPDELDPMDKLVLVTKFKEIDSNNLLRQLSENMIARTRKIISNVYHCTKRHERHAHLVTSPEPILVRI